MYDEGETMNFGEKYDYDSLMHYSAYAFSKNRRKTIVTKSRNRRIGQRQGLSDIDIRKINKLYCSKDWARIHNVKPTTETNATKLSTDNTTNDDKQSSEKSNVQSEYFRKRSKKSEHRHTSLWQ
ncbi:hypothetical protein ILUMI_19142 [Ignelater luminosus]|uniref:Metalloendopeptidase n=1 Tax=Ignelater luminosus TaxID=2038154 RepID=A0A8K0CIN9_IGNLU|nr:hypothetical protein ILUMI_19142 [Ignelater luminosus]